MAVRPMTSEGERQIMAALVKVAAAVAGGSDPSAAIAKVAAEDQLPRGYVPLMVNAYNVGQTARMRTDGKTPAEKSASFPVADTATVFERLFPSAYKTAADKDTIISPEYQFGAGWYQEIVDNRLLDDLAPALIKAATVLPPLPKPKLSIEKLAALSDRANRAAETARATLSTARDYVASKLDDLGHRFAKLGNLSVADVRPAVKALYGAPGELVLDRIVATSPLLGKVAARRSFHAVMPGMQPYATIVEVIAAAERCKQAELAYQQAVADADAAREAFRPTPNDPTLSVVDVMEKAATLRGGMGWALGEEAIKAVGGGLPTYERDGAVRQALRRIATPEHEQALADIESRAQLAQLFNHDDVVSGYDPNEAASHFNRISQFAPHAARQPLLATPLLRRSLAQGQFDTFDAGELANTESKLRDAWRPPSHQPSKAAPSPAKHEAKHASASVLD